MITPSSEAKKSILEKYQGLELQVLTPREFAQTYKGPSPPPPSDNPPDSPPPEAGTEGAETDKGEEVEGVSTDFLNRLADLDKSIKAGDITGDTDSSIPKEQQREGQGEDVFDDLVSRGNKIFSERARKATEEAERAKKEGGRR